MAIVNHYENEFLSEDGNAVYVNEVIVLGVPVFRRQVVSTKTAVLQQFSPQKDDTHSIGFAVNKTIQ